MTCCGKQKVQGNKPNRPSVEATAPYQYVGTTALTTIGVFTNTRYRFDSPGAIVKVNLRDAPSLSAIPQLRRVYLP